MGVRNFEVYLTEHQIIETGSLSLLKDCKILVEGHLWLKRILTGPCKEPSPVAMGGAPIALKTYITKEIENFKANGIKPTFVFTSLIPIKNDKPFTTEDKRPAKRAQAWEAYENNNSELAASLWNSAASIYQPELLNSVFKTLSEQGQHFIRAPYSSWAQIAYLSRSGQAHGVLGGTESLLFGVESLITSINYEKNEFNFIHKSKTLQEMGINDDQLLEAAVLAGFDYCSTFPPLEANTGVGIFRAALDMVKHHKTGFNAIQAYIEHPDVARTNYVDNFCRAVCSVKYQPYLSNVGVVESHNSESTPNDLQTLMGYRLPDEVYYYLSKGLISHHVVSSLVTGIIVDNQPLSNGEFGQYRKLLKDLTEIRSQTFALLTRHLHGFFQSRKVHAVHWFEPKEEHNMIPRDSVTFPKLHTAKWRCDLKLIENQKKIQNYEGESELFFAIVASKSPKFLETDDSVSPIPLLETTDQILTTTIIRFLELRGFLDYPNECYPYGIGISKALEGFQEMPNDLMEGLIIALELFKLGILNNEPFEQEYTDSHLVHIPEEERKHARLFSRVLSLLPMTFSKSPYSGPVDRNLLCFQSCVRIMNRSLRNYIEMVAMGVIIGGETTKNRKDITEIGLRLPFTQEPSTALGVLAKIYLNRICQHPNTDIRHWLEPAQLPKTFESCADVEEDLLGGFDFWDQVYIAVTTLNDNLKEKIPVVQQFIDANKWLENKRL